MISLLGENHAAKEGFQPQDRQLEHPQAQERGQTTEAGRGYRFVEGGEESEEVSEAERDAVSGWQRLGSAHTGAFVLPQRQLASRFSFEVNLFQWLTTSVQKHLSMHLIGMPDGFV